MKNVFRLLGLLGLAACAGESFGVAEGGAAGSAFPPLDTTSGGLSGSGGSAGSEAAAGAGGSSAGAGGSSAGAGGSAPTVSSCGELRGAAGDDELEVCIEASSFTMGDSDVAVPAAGDYYAHGPAHEVTLSAYVLDAYEVTVARYRACVDAAACSAPSASSQGCTYTTDAGSREQFPVTCVSWDQAYSFCAWDESRRLPTEAEWERAARSTDARRFAWGNDTACVKAVYGGSDCPQHAGQSPKAIGSTPTGASAEGAFDLTGNAWEWVNDWSGPYSSADATDPTGPDGPTLHILRGGNWETRAPQAAAFMRRTSSGGGASTISFRCARDATSP